MPNKLLSAHDVGIILASRLMARHAATMNGSALGLPQSAETLFALLAPQEQQEFIKEVATTFSVACPANGTPSLYALAHSIAQQWGTANSEICFYSSGTTGTPVPHRYRLATLWEEAKAFAPLFSQCQRFVSVMPSHHIFGCIFSVILPKVLGVPVLRLPPLPTTSFFESVRPADVIVAFPFFWQSLLVLLQQLQTSLHLPPHVMGVTSTAPCPPEVIEGLTSLPQPLECMAEVYGSTETSGIGFRQAPSTPYTLLSVWQSMPHNTETALQRVLPAGESFSPQTTPDTVQWVDATHFYPEKRKDFAVQVGGVNVYPERIAACIETHPAVKQCVVRLMQPEEGGRLKAFIVPALAVPHAEREHIFGAAFRQWLAERLETAARPKSITLGNQLPRNDMGKLADWPIKKRYALPKP